MQIKKSKKVFSIVLVYPNNVTRTVKVRATTREIAERRAMKRNPNAVSVQHDA